MGLFGVGELVLVCFLVLGLVFLHRHIHLYTKQGEKVTQSFSELYLIVLDLIAIWVFCKFMYLYCQHSAKQ